MKYFILLWAIFIFSICIHELGHIIVMTYNKMKISAVVLPLFSIINYNKKWKVRLLRNIGNSCVIPEISTIENKDEYEYICSVLSKSLLAGCITTLVQIIVGLILLFISKLFNIMNQDFVVSIIIYIIVNVLLFCSCFYNHTNIIGDYNAYKIIKKNKIKTSLILANYTYYSINQTDFTYLHNIIDNNILISNTEDWLSYITDCISLFFRKDIIDLSLQCKEKIDSLLLNTEVWFDFTIEEHIICLIRMLEYEIYKGNITSVKLQFNTYLKSCRNLSVQSKYYINQLKIILGIIDDTNIINNYKQYILNTSFNNIYDLLSFIYKTEERTFDFINENIITRCGGLI